MHIHERDIEKIMPSSVMDEEERDVYIHVIGIPPERTHSRTAVKRKCHPVV